MARVCTFTGKHPNTGNKVSHSNIKTKMRQFPNLHLRRLWSESQGRWVRLKLSSEALRTIRKKGLEKYAEECGVDLSKY